MGQYYLIANMDKKEVLTLEGRFPGMKLLEIADDTKTSIAITNIIAEKWNGDHICLVGDYADLSNADVPYFNTLRTWIDRFHLTKSLFKHIADSFQKVEGDPTDKCYRFLYNHDKHIYLDLLHLPESYDSFYENHYYINPLPLLIAMGNGRGGGDYWNPHNENYVGSWCDSIMRVEITKEPIDELGYEEFHPDFRCEG